ncbi:MAG TPA: ATP-binding cassette domain-containing protein [Streptosporangiaceae bacterium]|nr:ATP-binding cassette domain-containing protein [Streptosporangiaceae bacterium]
MRTDAAIRADGLVKNFGETKALAGLSLAVPRGSVFGLLGPNGAGKTTCVRVFATLLRPDGGHAEVLGFDVVKEAGQVRERIGLTGQYAALDDYLSGRANLVMIGQLGRLTGREAKRRADDLLERFDLTGAAGRAVKTYSGGMRRRLDLAASLIGRPEVLFLDEPTTGLDPRSRAVMWDIIRELAAEGTTLLLTTQYLEEADQLAGRVAVIDTGTVIAQGTPDELKEAVGGERVEITLIPGADLDKAAAALTVYTAGPVRADAAARRLDAPITASGSGITTRIVRALDDVGIEVDRIGVRRPSLDDVFLNLTGHQAESKPGDTSAKSEDSVPNGNGRGEAGAGLAGDEDGEAA